MNNVDGKLTVKFREDDMRILLVRRAAGQSLPVLALMLLVLVGFVGLSVDVGNAYGRQRRIQSASNAGALAGMLALQQGTVDNQTVLNNITKAMVGHGVNTASTDFSYTWTAYYGVSNGTSLVDTDIKTYPATGYPPAGIKYIRVDGKELVTTFFARVLGRQTLPAVATGVACAGGFGTGIYPIALPYYMTKPADLTDLEATHQEWNWVNYPAYNTSGGGNADTISNGSSGTIANNWGTGTVKTWGLTSTAGTSTSASDNLPKGTGKIFTITFDNKTGGEPGTHMGWAFLNSNGDKGANDLGDELTYPGIYFDGRASCNSAATGCYEESAVPSGAGVIVSGSGTPSPDGTVTIYPDDQLNHIISVYDWITTKTGVVSSSSSPMDEHMRRGDKMILPLYGEYVKPKNARIMQILV